MTLKALTLKSTLLRKASVGSFDLFIIIGIKVNAHLAESNASNESKEKVKCFGAVDSFGADISRLHNFFSNSFRLSHSTCLSGKNVNRLNRAVKSIISHLK
jgi:hypothetical protein